MLVNNNFHGFHPSKPLIYIAGKKNKRTAFKKNTALFNLFILHQAKNPAAPSNPASACLYL